MTTAAENRRANVGRLIVERFNDSLADFARQIQRDDAQVWQFVRGDRNIGERLARHIEARLALEHGSLDLEPSEATKVRVGYVAREEPLPPFKARIDTIDIPVFDVVASMGLGAAMPEHDTVVDHMRLTRTWLDRHLPSGASLRALSVISAYGDSMQPTFNDGDILLVDRTVTELRLDAVYVLAFHDELYIKRIQRRPDGSLAIISDNKVYEPITVPAGEKETVKVLGRVVWAWNGKRL